MNNEITSATRFIAVTPDNDTVLPAWVRCLYVGTSGNVTVVGEQDEVTFSNVPNGTLLPVQVNKVKSTGTTASDIVAMG
jgi:hypothetical protein